VTHEPAITTLDYDDLRDSLAAAGAVVTLAELHGGLAGALCAGGAPAATLWLADWLEDQELEPPAELNDLLTDVLAVTWRMLEGRQLEFEPLLPSDDAALEEQVQALALWCHGFVAGLGASAPELAARTAPDDAVAEVIRDFTEISRAGLSDEEAAGEDQPDFALAELREYLRAGVQIVFEELAERRAAARDLH
jgi:yecA family protein